MPVYEALIEPLKHQADFIVPNNQGFSRALTVLAGYLRTLL
jgi:uridine kinase